MKCKQVFENVKDASQEVSSGALNKTLNYVMKFQDLAQKYPSLRTLNAILKEAAEIMHLSATKTTEIGKDFIKLSDEKMKPLFEVMTKGDKDATRYTSKELRAKGMDDSQILAYNAYRNANDEAFKNMVQVRNDLILDKDLSKAKTEALQSFMTKTKVARNKAELFDMIRKSGANEHELELAKGYTVGWVERSRGTGTHAVEVRDSSGKVIYLKKVSPFDTLKHGKEKLQAEARELSIKNLAEIKAKNNAIISKKIDKVKIEMEKVPPNKRAKYDKAITRLEKEIEKNNSRTISAVATRKLTETELTPRSLFDTIEALNQQKTISVEKYKRSLEARTDLTPKDVERKLEEHREKLDAIMQPMKDDIRKQANSASFKRHSIHRSKEYIAGVDMSNPRADFVNYINQSARAEANVRTSSEAFDALANIEDISIRKIGRTAVNEAMRNLTDVEKMANTVASANFNIQFMGNVNAGIVNLVGNFGNAIGEMSYMGLKSGEATKLYASSVGSSVKMIGKYLGEKASKKDLSFADFIRKQDFSKDSMMGKIMDRAIANGLAFDVTIKELQDLNSLTGIFGKVQKALTIAMSMTERTNRVATVMSAVKMVERHPNILKEAIEAGHIRDAGSYEDNLLRFADHLSSNINAEYGRLGRSQMESGSGGLAVAMRTAFPFQTYVSHQLLGLYPKYMMGAIDHMKHLIGTKQLTGVELNQARNGMRAFINMNMWMGVTGGASAVPMMGAYNALESLFTDEPNSVEEAKTKDDVFNKLYAYGIPSLVGADVTGSTTANLPYISGSYIASRWNNSDSIEQLKRGNIHQAFADNFATPAFVKNIDAAIFDTDVKSKSGATQLVNDEELKRGTIESIAKAMGFKTTDISSKKQIIQTKKALDTWVTNEKRRLNYMYAEGKLEEEDVEKIDSRLEKMNELYGTDYSYEPTDRTDKEYELEYQE